MASSSLSSIKQRKKILTYGRKPSPANRHDTYDFFAPDELSHDTPIKRRRLSPPEPVQFLPTNEAIVQTSQEQLPAQTELPRGDTFDVPSDDDNVVEIVLPRFSSRKLKAPSKLVDDRPVQQPALPAEELMDDAPSPASVASKRSGSQVATASATSSTLSALERLKLRKRSLKNDATSGAIEISADSSASSSPAPYGAAISARLEPWTLPHSTITQSTRTPGKLRRAKKSTPNSSTQALSPRTTPEPELPAYQVGTPRSSRRDESAALSLTPKQSKLWDGLLDFVPEPEHDTVRKNTRGDRMGVYQHASRPRKHVRLADSLGLNTSPTDVGTTDAASAHDVDVDAMDIDPPSSQRSSNGAAAMRSAHRSEAPRKSERSDRRTYSQQRSYLGTDELNDMPQRNLTATAINTAPARSISKRSENLDFEISDSEDKSGKVQSIHELRAAGKSFREAATIENLLADLQNRTASARKQRQLAIVRLGTSVLDAARAKQFVQSGHDLVIVKELAKTSERMTSALLMSMTLLLLRADLSPITLGQLKLSIPRMIALLDHGKELRRIVIDDSAPPLTSDDHEIDTYLHRLADLKPIWLEETPETLNMRVISKQLMHVLFHKLRQQGDQSELLTSAGLESAATGLASMSGTDCMFIDQMLGVSILESASMGVSIAWPAEVVNNVALLLRNQSTSIDFFPQLRFLSYRLAINMTNGTDVDHAVFAKQGAVSVLLHVISDIFEAQSKPALKPDHQDVKAMDLLVLAIGIMSNLTEYSSTVRQSTLDEETQPFLLRTIKAFRSRHETAREVDSEDGTTSNVAYGYLAVMLANLAQEPDVRSFISEQLAGRTLNSLIEAIEEFIAHHRRLDAMHFDGAEGKQLWSSETARLEDVLQQLRSASST